MPAQFRLTYEGKTSDLDVTTLYVATSFERKFDVSFQAVGIDSQRRMEWVAFLVYKAAESQGVKVPAKFDDFLMANPTIEPIEDEGGEGTNPTDGAQ